jgi:hypothetical protein
MNSSMALTVLLEKLIEAVKMVSVLASVEE